MDGPLRTEYDAARARSRTALAHGAWREELLTQIAVA